MTRESRDRIAEQEILAGQEPAAEPEPQEELERGAAFDAALRDSVPDPFVTSQNRVLFSIDDLARYGLSPAEIQRLAREGAVAKNGMGTVEYDEDVVALQAERATSQRTRLAILDAGNAVRVQLRQMESYFAGKTPDGRGQYCKRYRFVSPTDEIVGINGYVFQIPAYVQVMLPTEVLDILQDKYAAQRRKDVLSAIYQARANRPVVFESAGMAEAFHSQVISQHHVPLDRIPQNSL